MGYENLIRNAMKAWVPQQWGHINERTSYYYFDAKGVRRVNQQQAALLEAWTEWLKLHNLLGL